MQPLPERLHQLSPELLLKQQPLLHCAFDVHGSPDSPEDSPDEAHAETKNAKIRCHERKLCIFVTFLCLLAYIGVPVGSHGHDPPNVMRGLRRLPTLVTVTGACQKTMSKGTHCPVCGALSKVDDDPSGRRRG